MLSTSHEWLESDGLGGFAMGTATGIRTRRYHALLLPATTPPTGRCVLVNGLEAWVETPNGTFALSSQIYAPGVLHPDGAQRIEAFGHEPWPHWIYKLEDGTRIEVELFVARGEPLTCVSWKLLGPARDVKLFVRPLLSGRDYHALHKSNPGFRFDAEQAGPRVTWQPYPGLPGITALTNGGYDHHPAWYYNFRYEEEQARGLDCEEDLASPGVLTWNLSQGKAALVLTTREHAASTLSAAAKPLDLLNRLREREQKRRAKFTSPLHAAADAYIVRGLRGTTVMAGYPWFTDWGRDTFIALRGLCIASGRLDDARDILLAWTDAVSEGMLPNRFPDQGAQAEYNSVDASLWFIIAAHEYLVARTSKSAVSRVSKPATGRPGHTSSKFPRSADPEVGDTAGLETCPTTDEAKLRAAIEAILDGYSRGTRFGIRMNGDGLLACGVPGVQLTWMDAKVGDWVVTPRIGKPVEVQTLWLNALHIGSQFNPRWGELLARGTASFRERFWNEAAHCLHDVVDVDHQRGTADASFRPNQIFAIGGLPLQLLDGERARLVVEAVEDRLLAPLGLRSLAPGESGYAPRYQGSVRERDGAYHQGTVWPWLIGPFVEAWVRIRGGTNDAKRQARARFVAPLLRHLDEAGLGHISEIADAEAPFTGRGCPFQAWSVGELLRLEHAVLAETPTDAVPVAQTSKSAVSPVSNRPGARPHDTLTKSDNSQAGSTAIQQTRTSARRTKKKPALQPAA